MTPQDEAAIVLAERRRERTLVLRTCRPLERLFLKGLAECRYEPYAAGERLGISSHTVWKLLKRPRVHRAMELFLQDALDDIGVSHASLVADLKHIKDQCIKHLATDVKAAAGAIAAIGKLMELTGNVPTKRLELTTRDGGALPAPVFNISFDDGGPGDYGIEVSGTTGRNVPSSDALN